MSKMLMAFFSLVLTGSAFSTVDLTTELKKLNEASESERHFCTKLEKELKAMDVFNHDANPKGPTFKSKELALRSLNILTRNDLGPSQNTSNADASYSEEKGIKRSLSISKYNLHKIIFSFSTSLAT